MWYGGSGKGSGLWLSHKCYDKYIKLGDSNSAARERKRLYQHQHGNPRRIFFRGRKIYLKKPPRTGVCSRCGVAVGEVMDVKRGLVCGRTQMNHLWYDADDPLSGTREMCVPCHRRYHKKLRAMFGIGKSTSTRRSI
jgi:hypothetical protein